jgi:hypothetical protein
MDALRKAYILGAVLLGFGYTTVTVLSLLMGVPSGPVNFAVKAGVAFLFLMSLPYALVRLDCVVKTTLPVIVFLSIYSIRLLYDVVIRDIHVMGSQSSLYVLGYFFGLTLIPVMAVSGAVRKADLGRIAQGSYVMLVASNVSLIVFAINSGLESIVQAFAGRLQADGSVDGTSVLNPIGIGLMGACLAAISMARLVVGARTGWAWVALNLVTLIIGLINILLGASRGPAVAFAICVIAVVISLGQSMVGRGGIGIKPRSVLYIVTPLTFMGFFVFSADNPVFLIERLSSFLEGRSQGVTEERDFIQMRAWEDFRNSPVVGSSYLVSLDNSFAHNIGYEALISTGLLGTILLCWIVWRILRALFRGWRGVAGPDGYGLTLIVICFATIQLTSGTIGQTPEFWVYSSLLMIFTESTSRRFGDESSRSGICTEIIRRDGAKPTVNRDRCLVP